MPEAPFTLLPDCPLCVGLPPRRELAAGTSAETIEGLEYVKGEFVQPGRYWDASDMLERCPTCARVLTDQFAADPRTVTSALMERGRKIRYEQRPRAEEDVVVAAASILARAEFLDRLAALGERFGTTLEKGASAKVELCARAFVAKQGKEKLPEVAKMHFQTTGRVLQP